MEHIKDLIPGAIETLVAPTKVEPATTKGLEKHNLEFETLGDPQLVKMLDAAHKFCADLTADVDPHWLSFLGSSGAGKTHLAKRIARYYAERLEYRRAVWRNEETGETRDILKRQQGKFVSWRIVSNRLRECDYRYFADLCDYPFLAVDDIGAEYGTPFVTSKLDELCDRRVGKWTVVTANYSLPQIGERMDTRIASRMLRNNSVVVDVNVIDYSLRKTAA